MSNGDDSAAVVVERVPVPEWADDLLLGRHDQAELLIMPQRVRDGRGEYRDADLQAARALHAAGVRVDWAHAEPEDRTFVSEYSADVAVFITLFVVQSLAQASVVEVARWLLAMVRQALAGGADRRAAAPLVVEVDRVKVEGTRRVIEGLRVTGHDEGVVEVVKTLLEGGSAPM